VSGEWVLVLMALVVGFSAFCAYTIGYERGWDSCERLSDAEVEDAS
jgi:hypothetical protein